VQNLRPLTDPDEARDEERRRLGRQRKSVPRPFGEFALGSVRGLMGARGFASADIVVRWADIAGEEIAALSEPIAIEWPKRPDDAAREPGTLVLRVPGHWVLEVQMAGPVILERVNRYFGWRAVGRLQLRQAPLARKPAPAPAPPVRDTAREAALAAELPIQDEGLKAALARLGAALGR
jgi:hypothetical protein